MSRTSRPSEEARSARRLRTVPIVLALVALGISTVATEPGVFVRFKLVEPASSRYYVRVGGYIHVEPWYLPAAVWPPGADEEPAKGLAAGVFSEWLDLRKHAGPLLHGQMHRAGGIAEFPNVTADFVASPDHPARTVVIELATAPDARAVVKRFEESFTGTPTSFLVSPRLVADRERLETASQMTARRLGWAREASGGRRVAPERLIVQTTFWDPQRPELNVREAEVLWFLGFNLVDPPPEARTRFDFTEPAGVHWVEFGPNLTRADIEAQIQPPATAARAGPRPTLFGFPDELVAPPIGTDATALRHFREWLRDQGVRPEDLGARALHEVRPIESPDALRQRQRQDRRAANRVFYHTTRFRQVSATERLRWLTESFHRHAPAGILTTTLVADHPYFGGSGLGMGMDAPNLAWSGYPLSLDWFDLAARRVVDVIGVEDWLGLQYMYGPRYTWEGFQLLGFQTAIFRSGGRGGQPIIVWITPSDQTNLVLKSSSALSQGAKHFHYWAYGPTATSTENYWSDLRGAYDGIARMTRQLAGAEHVIAAGRTRPTRVALLYSLSADLWQPWGYIHMLERRAVYLALVHEHYLVDMVTEEDVAAGRLADYDVLYTVDPNISARATATIAAWVRAGGYLFGACGAGSRDEFNEPVAGLSPVFGIAPTMRSEVRPGEYRVRGVLNAMEYFDQVRLERHRLTGEPASFGVLGLRVAIEPVDGRVIGRFTKGGAPAAVAHQIERGWAVYLAACPGLSYLKDARFAPAELRERYPDPQRRLLRGVAEARGALRLLELSHPVVEAGVFDAAAGTALVLANFTYEPIEALAVRMPMAGPVRGVRSLEHGPLRFAIEPASPALRARGYDTVIVFTTRLGLNDIVLLE
jgi:hypothetical protein